MLITWTNVENFLRVLGIAESLDLVRSLHIHVYVNKLYPKVLTLRSKKFFFTPNFLTLFLFNPNFFGPKFLFGPKFSEPKIVVDSAFALDSTFFYPKFFFLTQKFFWLQNFFNQIFLFNPKYFWLQNFC